MAVTTLFIAAPGDNFRTTAVRPEFQVRWTDGVGSFDVLHEWDTVNTFNSGNLITDNNTSVTSPDNGVPPSDMSVGAWFYRATITDNNDAQNTASSIYDVEILDEDDLLQFLYLNTNVGPGYVEGVDGDPKSFSRFLYLQGEIIAGIPVPFITSITPSSVDQLDTITIRGNGFDNGARDWEAVARLYDNPDPEAPGATFVALPEVSFSAGATEDVMVVTIPAGAPSGWVCVLNDADTGAPVVYQYSNTKKLLVAQGTPDADAGWRFEGVDHENNTVLINDWDVAKGDFHQIMNDIGNGSIYLPAGDGISEWVEPFVTLTGANGHYVGISDTNLLTSRAAHGQQSAHFDTYTAQIASTTQTRVELGEGNAYFGDWVTRISFAGGDVSDADATEVVTGVLGGDSTTYTLTAAQYTATAWVRFSSNWPDGVDVRLADEGSFVGATGEVTTLADGAIKGVWQPAAFTFTPDAGDLVGNFALRVENIDAYDGLLDGTEYFEVGACVLRTGTSTEFVPSAKLTQNISIEATVASDWASNSVGYGMIAHKNTWTVAGYLLRANWVAGYFDFFWTNASGVNKNATGPAFVSTLGLSDGAKVNICAELDIATADVAWYRDGVLVETDTSEVGPTNVAADNRELRIGTESTTSNLFDGDVYFVKIRDGKKDGLVVAEFLASDVRNAVGQSV